VYARRSGVEDISRQAGVPVNDPWHDLSHAERRRIAASLGIAADRHFRSACAHLGIQYRDVQHFPVLIVDLYRAERVLRARAEGPGASLPAKPSRCPQIAR
jgi:hypothetical protein